MMPMATRSARKLRSPSSPERAFILLKTVRQKFQRTAGTNAMVQSLRVAIESRFRRMVARNPLRADFQERYDHVVREDNGEKDRIPIERTSKNCCGLLQTSTGSSKSRRPTPRRRGAALPSRSGIGRRRCAHFRCEDRSRTDTPVASMLLRGKPLSP